VEIDLDGTRIRAGAIPVQQISAKHLVAIRAALLASGTKGRRSVKSVKNMVGATLRRMLRDALSIDGLLVADPYVAIRGTWPRVVTPAPDPFDQTERDALLGWFLTSAPQHHAAVATLFLTGMRPSELAGLRWGDIDLGRSLVTIERSRIKTQVEATKTQSSRRTIPVVATVRDLIAGLQPLRPDPDEYVFRGKGGRPINHANLQARDWRRALQKLQIRPRKLYATRATFISLTLSNGAPAKGVAEYCGTSLAMLQRNYSRYMGDPNSILGAIAMPAPATERIVAVAGVPSA
jgi:integrase/recombinase XerC